VSSGSAVPLLCRQLFGSALHFLQLERTDAVSHIKAPIEVLKASAFSLRLCVCIPPSRGNSSIPTRKGGPDSIAVA
jgi:hypothetical protein